MRGTIRQRGKSWEVIVEIGRDPITGKRRQKSRSTTGGKRAAERLLADLLAEASTTGTGARTFGELLEEWFAGGRTKRGKPWSASTVGAHRQIIDRYLSGAIAQVPLRRLTPRMLDELYEALSRGGGVGGRPLADSTVHRIHVVVSSALGRAVRWGWLPENPAARAAPPSGDRQTDVEPPTPAQVVRLLEAARRLRDNGPELACFLRLSATCGMRPSEICDLRWDRIDLDAAELELRGAAVRGQGGLAHQATKTGKRRRLALDVETVAELRRHRAAMAERWLSVGQPFDPSVFVFTDDEWGKRSWRPDSVSRRFRRLAASVGLEGVDLYHLRHFAGTYMLASGIDPKTASGRLTHSTMAMLDKHYAHRVPASDRAAADALGRLIDGQGRR